LSLTIFSIFPPTIYTNKQTYLLVEY